MKKECNKELLSRTPLTPYCFYDDGDTWAFNVESYGKECEAPVLEKTEVIESGDIRTTVKHTYSFRSSKIWIYYTFYEKDSYIDVRYRVNWNEKHIVLKLMAETKDNTHTVAVPYGSAKRGKTGADVPMDEWNIKNIMRIIGADPEGKVSKLLSFAGECGDIADPWYTGNFDETYDDVLKGCNGLLSRIKGG